MQPHPSDSGLPSPLPILLTSERPVRALPPSLHPRPAPMSLPSSLSVSVEGYGPDERRLLLSNPHAGSAGTGLAPRPSPCLRLPQRSGKPSPHMATVSKPSQPQASKWRGHLEPAQPVHGMEVTAGGRPRAGGVSLQRRTADLQAPFQRLGRSGRGPWNSGRLCLVSERLGFRAEAKGPGEWPPAQPGPEAGAR